MSGSDSEVGTAGGGRPTQENPTRPFDADELSEIGYRGDVDKVEVGQQLGRYVVLGELGRGGMSVVYAAFDPKLDRRVALKVMRPGSSTPLLESTQRLQREAQALARLSHSNVVHVFDVGTVEHHVYIAMELVDGRTLRTWLAAGEGRPYRDIVAVLLHAGEGLAAAHAAGLVHLDFKPGNVLIGDDGRVRVVDFGLAREPRRSSEADLEDSRGSEHRSADSGARAPQSTTRLAEPLTEHGALVGTPGYISPEQLLGLEADARSDQFAFCVTLWEALYGRRPFRGASRRELERAVLRGKLKDPTDTGDVPVWLHRVLRRGLRRDPDGRYPNLAALLAAIRRDPVRRRRRMYVVAGSLAVVGGGVAVHELSQTRRRVRCADQATSLDAVWNPARADKIADRFMQSGLPYAADAWNKAEPMLASFATAWAHGRVDACEATHVRGDQSAELLDARIACLDRAQKDLEAALSLLEVADAKTIENALETVEGLPRLDVCSDPARVQDEMRVPDDPKIRAEVAALDAGFARLRVLRSSGHYAEAAELAPKLLERTRSLEDKAVFARYAVAIANVFTQLGLAREAEALLEEGLWAAEANGLDSLRAAILSEYTYLLGNLQGDHRRARWFAKAAHAALDRIGGDAQARGELLTNEAVLAAQSGDTDRAVEISRRVLAMREEFGFRSGDTQASIVGNMGSAYFNAGDYEAALENYEAAYAKRIEVFGPQHPVLAISLENLGNVLTALGRYDEALDRHREAYELTVRAKIPEGIRFAILLNNIAVSLHAMERNDEASEYWERSVEVWRRHDPNHAVHAIVLCNLGEIDRARGDHELGIERYRGAREILDVAVGPDHPYVAVALGGLGRGLADLGRFGAALPHLERAREIHSQHELDDINPAEVDFHLARALWNAGGPEQRARALKLARAAARVLATAGPTGAAILRELERWLEAKPSPVVSGGR